MPDKPVPENDPIVTKSYAPHYMIAVALLTATLLWALWDEAFGMRPWKAYQHVWKDRYTAFLKSAHSKSDASEKEVQGSSDYQKLKQNLDQATQQATLAFANCKNKSAISMQKSSPCKTCSLIAALT